MKDISLFEAAGDFAGDKDVARDIRERQLKPALLTGKATVVDFGGVDLATQSFIHALISDLVRSKDFDALELLTFRHCNASIRELIEIVAEYSQEDVASTPTSFEEDATET